MRARSLLLMLFPVFMLGCASSKRSSTTDTMTTIYVIRHAEKQTSDFDTPLSTVGEERARALSEKLADAGVQRIYATARQRTQQTVRPLAERLKLDITVMEPNAVDSLVRRIKAEDRGRVVLVAGHNNTVSSIVQGLSGWTVDPIPENVFDRLYRVELPAEGSAIVTLLHYGDPTP